MHTFIMTLLKFYPSCEDPNIFIDVVKTIDTSTNKTIKVRKYYKPSIEQYKWIPITTA